MRLPARVDWIKHGRTGIKVALRLDKRKMTFQAEYSGETIYSKDGTEIRRLILEAIEKSHSLTFQPAIRIEVARNNFGSIYFSRADFGAGLALAVSRFAFSREGGLRELGWDNYEANDIKHLKPWHPGNFEGKPEEFTLPYFRPNTYSYGSENYYLPYTLEVWEGLQRVVEAVESAKEGLSTFLEGPGVVARLIAISTGAEYPLLQSGDIEEA